MRTSSPPILTSVLWLLSAPAWSASYYIASSGSDLNNGTSKSTPWLHAPGMTGCVSNCASKMPAPGDQFIFKGGDSWHWSSSAGTPVGIPWSWTWSGASGNPIYIGVDQTWYTGGSWIRPVLNGDNPLSTSPVGTCSYLSNNFFFMQGNFSTFDNFEFKGMCWTGADGRGAASCPTNCDLSNASMNAGTHDNVWKNLYFHGWTHTAFSCSYTTQLNGTCDSAMAIITDSHSNGDLNNQYVGIVVDGSDSDPRSYGCLAYGGYDVHNFVCRYTSQGFVSNSGRYIHDNLIEYINESADGVRHSNAYELNGSNTEMNFYNNVIRHIGTIAGIGVNLWFNPGGNMYFYNNVLYDITYAGANYLDVAGASGTWYVYNNTLCCTPIVGNNTFHPAMVSANNHFIGATSKSAAFMYLANVTDTTSIFQSVTAANLQGYVIGNQYAPTASNNGTVRSGSDLSSSCGPNFATLCVDTTLAGTRTPSPRPGSGAWDVGAYFYGGSGGTTLLQPQTGLVAVSQ